MNGPATLGDLRGRENSVASSFRPTVAGILGESSRYALRLQTVRPAWRVGPRGQGRASGAEADARWRGDDPSVAGAWSRSKSVTAAVFPDHRPRSQTGRSTFTFHCTPSVPVPSWPDVSRTILFLPISSLAMSDFGACQTLELP